MQKVKMMFFIAYVRLLLRQHRFACRCKEILRIVKLQNCVERLKAHSQSLRMLYNLLSILVLFGQCW